MTHITRIDLDCGMPLLVEHHPNASSAAVTCLLPVGSASESVGAMGAATCLDEWIWRGAGDRDARGLSEALDKCGVQRSSQLTSRHLVVSAVTLGHRLAEALDPLTSVITSATLDDDSFEPVRDLTLQSLRGLRDEPQHRIMLLAKQRQFPEPYNRSGYGEESDLVNMTPETVRDLYRKRCKPKPAIFAAAGHVDASSLADQLNALLAGWTGEIEEPAITKDAARQTLHEEESTAQVHLVVGYEAPAEPHADSPLERMATSVLSGGMSGRLFTEVRERRSLCYSVHASYAAGRDFGAVFTYAGTTAQRAQETLDVAVGELHRLRQGVQQDEFDRALTGLKARLIMQGESTSARAASLATDTYNLGRPRSLAEIAAIYEGITLDRLNEYLAGAPLSEPSLVTIGPTELTPPWS